MQLLDRVSGILKSPSFSTLGIFAGASMVSTIIGALGGLLQARWIGPETLGQFQKYAILTGYVNILLIVVNDGLSRQFPYLIGKGDREEAERIAGVAKCWYLFVATLLSLMFLGLAIRSAVLADWMGVAGWSTQVAVVVSQTYGYYLQTMYRRSLEFKRLSYNGLIVSVVCFVSLVFVKFFGFFGMAARQICQATFRVWLDAKYLPVHAKAAWDKKRFLDLAKISIPLSMVGYLRTSFMTATFSYFVLRFCGQKDLGLFGVALSLSGFAQIFLGSLWQIFNVKLALQYGKNDSVCNTVRYLIKPTLFAVALAVVSAVLLCACVGPFVRICVPKYIGAIQITYVLAFDMFLTALRLPTEVLRMALQYRRIYTIAILRVALTIFAMLVVPKTIIWFAGCSLVGGLVDVVAGYYYLLREFRREKMPNKGMSKCKVVHP